ARGRGHRRTRSCMAPTSARHAEPGVLLRRADVLVFRSRHLARDLPEGVLLMHVAPLRLFVLAIVATLLVPAPALACPVCGLAGPGDNGWAYFAMTMMLSLLPLGFIGGVVY